MQLTQACARAQATPCTQAKLDGVKEDLLVLKSIWFNRVSGDDHAERLESFYGPQAAACEAALF